MPVRREIYSVNIQMILSIIPFVDLWAAYRVEKLTFWILFWIGSVVISSGVDMAIPNPTSLVVVLGFVIESIIAVGLMRYFTMNWNDVILNEEEEDTKEKG